MTNKEAASWLLQPGIQATFNDPHTKEAIRRAIKALEGKDNNVPSSDAISRKAAIELVRDVCDAIMSGCKSHYDSEVGDEVYDDILEVDAILKCNKEIRKALKGMPSAQPEIIRCKDCKYWIAHDKRCVYLNRGFAPNMWCCHAERRTENADVNT